MQKIHVHNDFDVHLNFTNIKTDYVSRVEFWTRRDEIFCCCKCDGSLKVEDDSNIVCYLNDHNLGTGKLNYNVIFQIPDPNYADGYKKVCQHYVSDIFLTSENGDTTVAIVKVIGGEEVTDLINRLSEFEKVFDNKQDKLAFDNTPTLGSKNVVYSDGIYNAIKNNKPDLSGYAKKSDLQGLATEQWVNDQGYLTSIPDDYVTETELDSKGYLTEHQSLDDYVKKSGPFPRAIATKQWVVQQKYVDELHLDAKVANKAYAIEQWVNDQGYLTSIPDDYVTETELDSKGYLTEHQSLADYATKSDLKRSTRDMATQYWVRNNYVSLKDFIEIVHTSIETVTPAEDTEYSLNSNQYLRIIPADAVKLTFNKSSDGATGIMREYHILIDCKTAVPTTEFKGVLWELDNEPVFEKGKLYDIVIRDYETNLFGSWKAYKLMGITILITTSDATDVQLNANTYNLVAGDNSLTNADLKTITDIDGFNGNDKITSIDFGSATIKIEDLSSKFRGMSNLTEIINIYIEDATSLSSMFASDTQLQKIDTSKWDTSSATNFSWMFSECSGLKTLDVSKWDTSSATDFSLMFNGCTNLETLDVSKWDTSSATDFSLMFSRCSGLTSLDLSGWNVSKGTNFSYMFNGCINLETLDVSKWDTSSAITFTYMFSKCSDLTSLDLSGWDTSRAIDFSRMFSECSDLTSLNLSNFNTSKVTTFSSMFSGCTNLKTLDLSGWNVSSATNFSNMFAYSGLTTLDLSNWDVGNASSFNSMFAGCKSLTSLDVSHFDTSKATDFNSMFGDCSSLTSLDVSHFDTSKATDFNSMFAYSGLTTLDLSNWDVGNASSFNSMFYGCKSLTSLDVSNFNTSNVIIFNSMFSDCSSLTTLDVSHWDTSSATDFNSMFSDCSSLTTLDVSHWDTSSATNFNSMFYGCTNLKTLDLSGWNVSKVDDFNSMFDNCKTLTSLDLSGWNISEEADIDDMFGNHRTGMCDSLTTIKMVGCSQETIDKINFVTPASATIITE